MVKRFKTGTDLTVAEYEFLENNILNVTDPYEAYLAYLKDKQGKCMNNYFTNKSCSTVLPSFNGLDRHHDKEYLVAGLSRPDVARANAWEYQEARNLTLCKPAEHALLHILIAEQYNLGIYGAMKILNAHQNIDPKVRKILEDRLNTSATVFTWNKTVMVKAVELLNTYRLCYMHIATGVGKSTSAIEVAKAVNRNFVVLSPGKKIIADWTKHNMLNPRFKGAYTYKTFSKKYNELVTPGMLVIADEAHHLLEKGKGTWGTGIIEAFENISDLMVLGLSASEFRAKNKKNTDGTMQSVWYRVFQGHVAQGIRDFAEGIQQGVLAPIQYVCACYNKEALNEPISLVANWADSTRKATLKNKLDIIKNETAIATLLNKYQPGSMVRDLVFVEHIGEADIYNEVTGKVEKINDYEQAKAAIKKARPELTDDNFRIVHSKQPEKVNQENFEWFETEADDARYLVSVGMVKEGYHPEILTGGIIFRRIGAATVFEQILGRFAVLKSKAKHDIVVFDFVDAVRSSKYKFESGLGGGKNNSIRPEVIQKLSQLTAYGVNVIDYTGQLQELTAQIFAETTMPVFTMEELL